ncbi:hypothetical protein R3P38DRAFT_3117104 [Favolaschia claudopus]|uniref:MYND-type domain-containing protein n=1 Tax=Favolaschia claudopus TaxID=2862362 RepID=A0AAV9ZFD7_9AGAR
MSLTFPVGSPDYCFRCARSDINLQACAQCRLVRYCSRACQKLDWPEHRQSCRSRVSVLKDVPDPTQRKDWDLFNRWLDHWSRGLFAWGVFASNVANQQPDYLATHCFLVRTKKCIDCSRRSSKGAFELVSSDMYADHEVAGVLTSLFGPEGVNAFEGLTGSSRHIRWVLICEMSYYLCHSASMDIQTLFLDTTSRITNRNDSFARQLAASLETRYRVQFGADIKAGDVEGWISFLKTPLVVYSA